MLFSDSTQMPRRRPQPENLDDEFDIPPFLRNKDRF